jgi:urea transport system substrate-binding protein
METALPAELRQHPRYQILHKIKSGGMGAVYRAHDLSLQRSVAIKVISGKVDKEAESRFRREITLLAKLTHPHIVAAYDTGVAGEYPFLVMEFIDGQSLAQIIAHRGALPVAAACELIRQAAVGLTQVHQQGMVHRDLKPGNLMLTPTGIVKLLDLGLARFQIERQVSNDPALTGQDRWLGTVDYMAPEQWDDCSGVDIRADIYSLGCTLYHLLVGQAPFEHIRSSTMLHKMMAHQSKPPRPIDEYRADVPDQLIDVIEKALAKAPKDRYQTPAEMAEALAPYASSHKITEVLQVGPASRLQPTSIGARQLRARRRLIVGLLASFALIVASTAATVWLATAKPFAPPEPIKVGILHSFTGTMTASESAVVDATKLALEELNAAGGVLGRSVQFVERDGASDPDIFAQQAEKLVTQDQVAVVFGCWTSASRKMVKPVVEKHNALLFYPVQYEGLETSKNIVYLGAAPNQQLLPAVKWCRGELGNRFFLVGSDYVFPRAAHEILKGEIRAKNSEVVGEKFLPLGSINVQEVVDAIKASKPNVILSTINGDSNVAFFRALRSAGVTPEVTPVLSFSIAEQELRSLGIRHLAGDYAAWNYFMSVERPENRAFIEKFQRKYGSTRMVTDPMESAYTGVQVWAKAVTKARSLEVDAVRAALGDVRFEGPGGPVHIDPDTQHAWKIFRIGKVLPNGSFDIIQSSDKPLPPQPYPPSKTPADWQKFLDDLQRGWKGGWALPES